uniref:Uncharacterized protein n=1 Tax=Rhizophora mucronata TaxID=61149 RepID=A0A2P2MRB7_RHIMU
MEGTVMIEVPYCLFFLLACFSPISHKRWFWFYCDIGCRCSLIFSGMIFACGKHIASPFRYASWLLLINGYNSDGACMQVSPCLIDV